LEKEDDFIELEERNLDDGAFDMSTLGKDDVNLQESSAKCPATGNVTEIKRKFQEHSVHARTIFCKLTAEHRAGMQLSSSLPKA